MTLEEALLGTQRLHEIEEKKLLLEESRSKLKEWWVEKLRADERGKIIPFPKR